MSGRGTRVLAAPVLGESGGGVGQVSSLLWRVMQDEWGPAARIVTLLNGGHSTPALADKLRFGIELAGKHVTESPEWILYSHLGLAGIAKYMQGPLDRPYAVFLHGIECWDPLPASDRAILCRAALRVANSHYTAGRTAAANPGIGEISVCPLGLPDEPALGAVVTGKRAGTRPTALMVGRLASSERYKGHEELIRVWPRVTTEVAGARLVIVGDGDDLVRLRALAAETAPGSIELTGFLSREQLQRLYRDADLFVLPSRGEGFGVVYLEAMSASLPCIGSVHDAAAEVIADGKTGVLVDPGAGDDMAAAIASLLGDERRARQMGEAGRARLEDHFTYAHFRARMSSLLNEAF